MITLEEALKASKKEVKEWYQKYLNPYLDLLFELVGFDEVCDKAQGSTLYINGEAYLDFVGSSGAVNLGHNHPQILEALESIKGRPNLLQTALSPLAAALAKNLALITPGKLEKSFFCNSGAEAVEGALKIARAATGKEKIIYCENSFHGRTLGALSVTGNEKYQAPFRPLVPGCEKVPFGDGKALEEKLKQKDVVAFIVEPLQGEAGIIIPPPGYLKEAEELCHKYKALLIVDEIQTGFGRTGKMFACEYEDVQPDILCLAKALSGALVPLGAYLATDKIWRKAYGSLERCLLHTSTFGGNSLACAAGLAFLNLLTEKGNSFFEEVRQKGDYFLGRLRSLKESYQLIKEVRGQGLMIGVEFREPSFIPQRAQSFFKEYFASLVASQLLKKYRVITAYTLNNPNTIRFEPPLTVKKEDLDYVATSLEKICEQGFSKTLLASTLEGSKRMGKRLARKIL